MKLFTIPAGLSGIALKQVMEYGALWVGFLVMLGMLLGMIDSPILGLKPALSSMKRAHDRQTFLLYEICRQGAKSEFGIKECDEVWTINKEGEK